MFISLLLLCLVIVSARWVFSRRRRFATLPPALPGLPIIGNVHQMPLTFQKFDQWKDQLGPIYSLNMAGQTIVVLASAKVAADVLDKMSAVTSGRPPWIMASELMSHNMLLNMLQYGEQWRRHRRAAHEALNARASEAFYAVQEDEALRLAQGLLSDGISTDLELHTTRAAASMIWRVLYGGPPLSLTGDHNFDDINDITNQLLKVLGAGNAIVDVFPFLNHLPKAFAPFKVYADTFYKRANGFFLRVYREACERKTVSGDPNALNLSAAFEEKKDKLGLTIEDTAWLGGMIFFAGAETSSTALQFFILAMLLYPDVAAKAHREIDGVLSSDKPPTFSDRDKLPYVQAIVTETLRWRPVVAVGAAHAATEDFVYQDYTIPKGTMIMNNLWSICRDPELFPDYDVFRPERFLSPELGGTETTLAPGERFDDFAFGYGRRICVGRDVAVNSLFIDIAILLWAFEFHKEKDEDGKEITPSDMEFHDMVAVVRPAPFPFKLVPRSEKVKTELRQYGRKVEE